MRKSGAMKLAAVPAMGVAAAVLTAAPASAADVSAQDAAQAAVDQYGGCTINVEGDDYGPDDIPAWEVEIRDADVNTENGGRIEVKVDKATGDVVEDEIEYEDSAGDEQCDPSLPAADGAGGGSGPIADFIDTIDVFGSLDVVKDWIG